MDEEKGGGTPIRRRPAAAPASGMIEGVGERAQLHGEAAALEEVGRRLLLGDMRGSKEEAIEEARAAPLCTNEEREGDGDRA